MAKYFLPQQTLEKWALDGKADLKEGRLVFADDTAGYPVVPAVHFLTLVTGSDELGLLAKVKTQPQLQKLAAEQMQDSVLVGEAAYQVVAGYLAEAPPGTAPPGADSETELLAAFLLDKLEK